MTKSNNSSNKPLKKYIKFSGLAFQMGITIFIGAKIGTWLDEKSQNTKKIFTAVCSLLAVIFSLINFIRKFKK